MGGQPWATSREGSMASSCLWIQRKTPLWVQIIHVSTHYRGEKTIPALHRVIYARRCCHLFIYLFPGSMSRLPISRDLLMFWYSSLHHLLGPAGTALILQEWSTHPDGLVNELSQVLNLRLSLTDPPPRFPQEVLWVNGN